GDGGAAVVEPIRGARGRSAVLGPHDRYGDDEPDARAIGAALRDGHRRIVSRLHPRAASAAIPSLSHPDDPGRAGEESGRRFRAALLRVRLSVRAALVGAGCSVAPGVAACARRTRAEPARVRSRHRRVSLRRIDERGGATCGGGGRIKYFRTQLYVWL